MTEKSPIMPGVLTVLWLLCGALLLFNPVEIPAYIMTIALYLFWIITGIGLVALAIVALILWVVC